MKQKKRFIDLGRVIRLQNVTEPFQEENGEELVTMPPHIEAASNSFVKPRYFIYGFDFSVIRGWS